MKKSLPKIFLLVFIIFALTAGFFGFKYIPELYEKYSLKPPPPYKKLSDAESKPSSESGKLKYPHDYTIVLLGDSMTEILGNSDELRGYLNQYFPDKTFEILNYGYGSTNILSAKERLVSGTYHGIRDYGPISNIDFDYLILESFGHNPLSEYGPDGIRVQNQALDDLVQYVATTSGKDKLVFMSTIGTNKETYAKTRKDLTEEARIGWARERDQYLENHIKYAKDHGIPVIDVFHASEDSNGSAKQYLIRDDDFIHPSPKGVLFISKKIADFLAKNNLITE